MSDDYFVDKHGDRRRRRRESEVLETARTQLMAGDYEKDSVVAEPDEDDTGVWVTVTTFVYHPREN